MERFPLVSAVMAAYNYGRFLPAAFDSALAQDYPADQLEIVIIDDGSTDETPEVIEEYMRRYPGRIRAYRQANAGLTRTTNEGMRHARGEFLALLDPDDTWLPHKTRAQVELLLGRPEVALVYGDMMMTDADDNVTHESMLLHNGNGKLPPRGRTHAELMGGNHATTSSVMMRSSLRPYYDPIPEGKDLISQDWWIAARSAIAGEIDYLDEAVATYRIHGANDFGGTTGARYVRSLKLQLKQARRMLTYIDPRHGLTVQDLVTLVQRLHLRVMVLMQTALSPFFEFVPVTDEDRAEAAKLLEAARENAKSKKEVLLTCHQLVKAYALNPYSDQAMDALQDYLPGALEIEQSRGHNRTPPFLAGARSFRTLAFAHELIEQPQLLRAYGRCFDNDHDATLVILAPEPELIDPLVRAVAESGLDGEDQADLVALSDLLDASSEAALAGAVHSVLSEQVHHPRFPAPHVQSASASALLGMAERHWQRA